MIIDYYNSNTEIVELLKLFLFKNEIKFEVLKDSKMSVEIKGIQDHIEVKLWCKYNSERLGWLGISVNTGMDNSQW